MFVSRNMYFLTLLVVASLAKTNANVNVSNETSKLIGKWDLVASENFEEYLRAIGVGWLGRKIGSSVKPTEIISRNGEKWIIRIETSAKSGAIKFNDGVEFTEDTMDGRKCKTTVSSEGPNKLVQIQKDFSSGKVLSTVIREIDDNDQMVSTLISGSVVSVRKYSKS